MSVMACVTSNVTLFASLCSNLNLTTRGDDSRWTIHAHTGAVAKPSDEPLIPQHVGAEEGLVADLERSGVAAVRARRIASAIATESSDAAVAVRAKVRHSSFMPQDTALTLAQRFPGSRLPEH